jgi:hypothetical protein
MDHGLSVNLPSTYRPLRRSGFFFRRRRTDSRPGGIPLVVGATRGGSLHHNTTVKAAQRRSARHRIVSLIHPLSTLAAERETIEPRRSRWQGEGLARRHTPDGKPTGENMSSTAGAAKRPGIVSPASYRATWVRLTFGRSLRAIVRPLVASRQALSVGSADAQAQGGNRGKDHGLHRNSPSSVGRDVRLRCVQDGCCAPDDNAAVRH